MTLLKSLYRFIRKAYRRWRYVHYLRSPHWQTTRHRILKRAGYRCERCHQAVSLDIHHLTYAHFGNERDNELQALCRACHREADRERRYDNRHFTR